MPSLFSLGFDNPCQMVLHCEYLLHLELWQRWRPPPSVLLPSSSCLGSDILYQVAPAWKFLLPCSDALIPHTGSPFNMATPSDCFGSDTPHQAAALYGFPLLPAWVLTSNAEQLFYGHPCYSSWVLIPCAGLPLTVWSPSSYCLDSVSPKWVPASVYTILSPLWTTGATSHQVWMSPLALGLNCQWRQEKGEVWCLDLFPKCLLCYLTPFFFVFVLVLLFFLGSQSLSWFPWLESSSF